MSVNKDLKDDIEKKNLKAIRDDLWGYIVLDPTLTKSFKTALQYCFDNGISESELYETHDGGNLNVEATKENFSKLSGELRSNFSKERLEKMKEIASIVYPPLMEEKNQKKKFALAWFDRHPDLRLILASSASALILGVIGSIAFKKQISTLSPEMTKQELEAFINAIKGNHKTVVFGTILSSVIGAGLGTTAGIMINKFSGKGSK